MEKYHQSPNQSYSYKLRYENIKGFYNYDWIILEFENYGLIRCCLEIDRMQHIKKARYINFWIYDYDLADTVPHLLSIHSKSDTETWIHILLEKYNDQDFKECVSTLKIKHMLYGKNARRYERLEESSNSCPVKTKTYKYKYKADDFKYQ